MSPTAPSPNPVILVTGASRGIGLATVEYLLGSRKSSTINGGPFNVVTLSRSLPEGLGKLQKEFGDRLLCVQGDVLEESTHSNLIKQTVDKYGRLDACVLNAGVLSPGRVGAAQPDGSHSESPSSFANQIATNLSSLFTTLHYALPHIRSSATGLGRVVITSSGAAVGNYAGWAAYNAGKAGVNALARTVANEEGGKVGVWSVRPGVVGTEMIDMITSKGHELGMDAPTITRFRSLRDEGKLLKPEDPAHVLAALAVRGTLDEPKTKDGEGIGKKGEFVSFDDEVMKEFWGDERREKNGKA